MHHVSGLSRPSDELIIRKAEADECLNPNRTIALGPAARLIAHNSFLFHHQTSSN